MQAPFNTTFIETTNAFEKKKRKAILNLFSALLKSHLWTSMYVTTAGCFQNKTCQCMVALFITLKKEQQKGTSSLCKPLIAELLYCWLPFRTVWSSKPIY